MKFRKFLGVILFSAFVLVGQNYAQERERVVGNNGNNEPRINRESLPVTPTRNPVSRPVLTNEIRIVNPNPPPLVKKTSSSRPTNAPPSAVPTNYSNNPSLAAFNQRLIRAMQTRLGIPYHYGSDGPTSYDCSGLVWSVFQDAGLAFTRTSAVSYYRSYEPVYGDERFKFGTLVFFNGLGHVGIVINENTFFHASSSKGVTFSKFEGYWSKRIVGFRRIPLNIF